MDVIIFFVVLTTMYGVALFFDMFFKSCMHYPYQAFLKNTGIVVKPLRIYWHTTSLNRTIVKWGSSCARVLGQSFNLGVITSLILLPSGIILLLFTTFGSRASESKDSQTTNSKFTSPSVELLLPGLNLPLEEIGYYILSLAASSIVHELGHAIAAIIEDVPVTGLGLKVFYCVPVAYTELASDNLTLLKPFRKLRVLCAGIWHNIVLASVCYFILLSLGIIFHPFYHINESVIVTEIHPKSPLVGEKGIFVGDVITEINECKVKDLDTWYYCLAKALKEKPGYCVSSDFIRLNDESEPIMHGPDGVLQCCDPSNFKLTCFEYVGDINNDDPLEIPQQMCLDIRNTVESSSNYCSISCSEGFCIRPLLNNATTILKVVRKGKFAVVYMGRPTDLYLTMKVSSYVPKTRLLSSYLADAICLLLKYTTVFSLGLGVINAIPCYGLDGQRITHTLIHTALANKIPDRNQREIIAFIITCLGTILFLTSTLKVIWSSLALWYT